MLQSFPLQSMARYVNVAVPLPVHKLFTYQVPEESPGNLIGVRALVPFGKRELTGVIVEELAAPPPSSVKPILELLDEEPLLPESLLRLTRWVAEYYFCSWGEALKAALPPGMAPQQGAVAELVRSPSEAELEALRRRAPKRAAILELLREHRGRLTVRFLVRQLRSENLAPQLHALEQQGYIRLVSEAASAVRPRTIRAVELAPLLRSTPELLQTVLQELQEQSPKQARLLSTLAEYVRQHNAPMPLKELLRQSQASSTTLRHLLQRDYLRETLLEAPLRRKEESEPILAERNELELPLTAEQQHAVQRIVEALRSGQFKTFLLRGVTGSGKTLVYMHAIDWALRHGKSVLMLVPEISLTPQLLDRFRRAFSQQLAVLHSRMSSGERYSTWRAIRCGQARVVLGVRSAVFAPLAHLGLIIVDEEHEPSYKQQDPAPRYHARDCAVMRAAMEGAVAVLGSATPSLESLFNAQTGKYHLLELTHRADGAQLPTIHILDRRQRDGHQRRGNFSEPLLEAITERLQRREGIILFHNRRGFARWLECPDCGHIPMCPNCSISLVFHKVPKQLRCHYCGHAAPVPEECPVCGAPQLREIGSGTQRIEEELERLLRSSFPQLRIERMDTDSTARKGAHRRLLHRFASGQTHILVGTQMVAKGLDLPHVTLVGVLNADLELFLPDFRASERAFQLLTQVAGRAGRRSSGPGEVYIQTAHPEHPAILAVQTGNAELFYHDELQHRKEALYPPFVRFVVVELSGLDEERVHQHAHFFAGCVPAHPAVLKIGPALPTPARVRNRYRRVVILKGLKQQDPSAAALRQVLRLAYARYERKYATSKVRLTVDVDAYGLF